MPLPETEPHLKAPGGSVWAMTLSGGIMSISKGNYNGGEYVLQSPDKSLWLLSIDDFGVMGMPVKVPFGDPTIISLLDQTDPNRTIYALTVDNAGILYLSGGPIPSPLPVYKCLICHEIFVRDPRFPHPCEDYQNPTVKQDSTWPGL